jgi:hypothetical protein
MKTMLCAVLMLTVSAQAVSFPVAPYGQCYDGIEKLVAENAYPGALIAYDATMADGRGHVWLVRGDLVIDSYFGEMDQRTWGHDPKELFNAWEEFDQSIKTYREINGTIMEVK